MEAIVLTFATFAIVTTVLMLVVLLLADRKGVHYVSFDCRGGVHGGCQTCSCRCHVPAAPNLENRSQ